MGVDIKTLHPLEVKVLRQVEQDREFTAELLREELKLNIGQCNQAVSWLSSKELIAETGRTLSVMYELTELGKQYAEKGTPAERMLALLKQRSGLSLPEIAKELELENRDIGSAFGMFSKAGVLAMDDQKRVTLTNDAEPQYIATARSMLKSALENGNLEDAELSEEQKTQISHISKKRGADATAFRIVEREIATYTLTQAGVTARDTVINQGVTGEEIGTLTPEILSSGEWKSQSFRSFNIHVPPKRVVGGRKNPYAEYLSEVKDKLVSLGFEEFDGPLVETEFWNGDALFMPQFHSARDIHDVYYLTNPSHAREIEQPWLDQVAKVHEDGWDTGSKGWGYTFDQDFTRRLVLRSQGTVLSAKQLPTAKVPGKYFGVVRCFRYDQVDATHGSDFYQTEGIVLGEEVNLRTLLGLLKMFAVEVAGATEFKFVPGYFPFTEPSIEVQIKHPVLGWFELGGSGIFRPEVTRPLGVDVPVLAWGLGIDRMALMQLGLDDLRELFSVDIEKVRLRKRS